MSQPLYFLPNIEARDLFKMQRLNRETLRRFGLEEVFADVTREEDCACQEMRTGGPMKKSGVLLAYLREMDRAIPQNFGSYEDINRWEVRTAGLETLIGWNPDQPASPEDLQRRRTYLGYFLESDSGQKWLVPVIRRPDDTTELPRDMYVNGDGKLHEPVKEAYRSYWDDAQMVCGWFLHPNASCEEIGFTKEKAFRLGVRALGINYRYGHAEQRICKAIDSTNFITALALSVDKPRFDEISAAAKKKPLASDMQNTMPGQPDDSPAIDQALLTSV